MVDTFHAFSWGAATMVACIVFGAYIGAHVGERQSGQERAISLTIIAATFLLVVWTAYNAITSLIPLMRLP